MDSHPQSHPTPTLSGISSRPDSWMVARHDPWLAGSRPIAHLPPSVPSNLIRVFGLGLPESLGLIVMSRDIPKSVTFLRKLLDKDLGAVLQTLYPCGYLFMVNPAPTSAHTITPLTHPTTSISPTLSPLSSGPWRPGPYSTGGSLQVEQPHQRGQRVTPTVGLPRADVLPYHQFSRPSRHQHHATAARADQRDDDHHHHHHSRSSSRH